MSWLTLSTIAAPPFKWLALGRLRIRAYGLMIALGVVAAVVLAERRLATASGGCGSNRSASTKRSSSPASD